MELCDICDEDKDAQWACSKCLNTFFCSEKCAQAGADHVCEPFTDVSTELSIAREILAEDGGAFSLSGTPEFLHAFYGPFKGPPFATIGLKGETKWEKLRRKWRKFKDRRQRRKYRRRRRREKVRRFVDKVKYRSLRRKQDRDYYYNYNRRPAVSSYGEERREQAAILAEQERELAREKEALRLERAKYTGRVESRELRERQDRLADMQRQLDEEKRDFEEYKREQEQLVV